MRVYYSARMNLGPFILLDGVVENVVRVVFYSARMNPWVLAFLLDDVCGECTRGLTSS